MFWMQISSPGMGAAGPVECQGALLIPEPVCCCGSSPRAPWSAKSPLRHSPGREHCRHTELFSCSLSPGFNECFCLKLGGFRLVLCLVFFGGRVGVFFLFKFLFLCVFVLFVFWFSFLFCFFLSVFVVVVIVLFLCLFVLGWGFFCV